MKLGCLLGLAALGLSACSSDSDEETKAVPDDGCTRGALEADLAKLPFPVAGAPATLAEPPAEGYVVSSTYLKLKPEAGARSRFTELMQPIQAVLGTQPGLLQLELGVASQCGTARTRSVWSGTEAMYEFVGSEAHTRAMQAIKEVSRGGSVVTHWTAKTLSETTWAEAATRLAKDDGPVY